MTGTGGGLLWTRHETSASIKRGEFFDWLRNYQLLKNISAAWSYNLMRMRKVWLVSARVTEAVAVFIYLCVPNCTASHFSRLQSCIYPSSQICSYFMPENWKELLLVRELVSGVYWLLTAVGQWLVVTGHNSDHACERVGRVLWLLRSINIDTNGVRQNGAPYVLWRKNLTPPPHTHTHTPIYLYIITGMSHSFQNVLRKDCLVTLQKPTCNFWQSDADKMCALGTDILLAVCICTFARRFGSYTSHFTPVSSVRIAWRWPHIKAAACSSGRSVVRTAQFVVCVFAASQRECFEHSLKPVIWFWSVHSVTSQNTCIFESSGSSSGEFLLS